MNLIDLERESMTNNIVRESMTNNIGKESMTNNLLGESMTNDAFHLVPEKASYICILSQTNKKELKQSSVIRRRPVSELSKGKIIKQIK